MGRELLLVNKANQINTYSFPLLKLQLKPCIVEKKPQKQNKYTKLSTVVFGPSLILRLKKALKTKHTKLSTVLQPINRCLRQFQL
jgi:hypothetical protein